MNGINLFRSITAQQFSGEQQRRQIYNFLFDFVRFHSIEINRINWSWASLLFVPSVWSRERAERLFASSDNHRMNYGREFSLSWSVPPPSERIAFLSRLHRQFMAQMSKRNSLGRSDVFAGASIELRSVRASSTLRTANRCKFVSWTVHPVLSIFMGGESRQPNTCKRHC